MFNPKISGEALRIEMFVSRPMKGQTLPIVWVGSPISVTSYHLIWENLHFFSYGIKLATVSVVLNISVGAS